MSEADAEMLRYSVKLTVSPASVGAADVDRLKAVGFTDTAVLDICQVVSYYNYVNRLADGLGVELEDHWDEGALTVTKEEFETMRTARRAGGDQ